MRTPLNVSHFKVVSVKLLRSWPHYFGVKIPSFWFSAVWTLLQRVNVNLLSPRCALNGDLVVVACHFGWTISLSCVCGLLNIT